MFKITNVSTFDGHLVVRAEHHHPDGSLWFAENYRWQGRQAFQHKRKTNANGELLMDNGRVAPLGPPDADGIRRQYLPEERDWARYDSPHMDEGSILGVIQSIHEQRLVTGWPEIEDVLVSTDQSCQEDQDGCRILLDGFAHLVGREV